MRCVCCVVVRGTWCLPQRGEEEGRRIYGGKEKEERAQWSNLEEEKEKWKKVVEAQKQNEQVRTRGLLCKIDSAKCLVINRKKDHI